MRCFVPATDDEIYALIERYGVAALQPYRPGMRIQTPEDSASPQPERRVRASFEEDSPRRAA